jgi:hypothetical protein
VVDVLGGGVICRHVLRRWCVCRGSLLPILIVSRKKGANVLPPLESHKGLTTARRGLQRASVSSSPIAA